MSRLIPALLLLMFAMSAVMLAAGPSPQDRRERAKQALREGNHKDAYEGYRALALDPADGPKETGKDLKAALNCLEALGRINEIDDFREAVVAAHKDQWRTLMAAAWSIAHGHNQHYGFLVAGKFERGNHRGGGRFVGSTERDRVRALQWLTRARELARDDPDRAGVAELHFECARVLRFEEGGRDPGQGWRFQILTNLDELPDYDENPYGPDDRAIGAPVDAEGRPVYFHLPKTYGDARNDGERWRWLIARAVEIDPAQRDEAQLALADFFQGQFGVQTIAGAGGPAGPQSDDGREDESGPFALASLGEDETIARLATGVKRFKLPDEFNYLKIYRAVAEGEKSPAADKADDSLGQIYEDRRQYPRAADVWTRAIARYGPGEDHYRQKRLDQIVGNWGQFGTEGTQPTGKAIAVGFRFRNGKKVHFEAHAIRIPKLLDDVKAYVKALPNSNKFDWNKVNLANIGYRLVNENERQYLGDRAEAWDLELDPRPEHRDRRITVKTPLKKAGAYLLTAKMEDGNTSRIVVWVADTAIVRKATPNGTFFFVADAVTGQPVARANLECFGFQWEAVEPKRGVNRIVTANFAEATDQDGQAILSVQDLKPEFQWLTVARTDSGRLAFVGFSNVWHSGYEDQQADVPKLFVITDRPVYRPGQPVKFKGWVRHARYGASDDGATAHKPYKVKINNPKSETVFEREFKTDDFGGFDGEFTPSTDATLGSYTLFIDNLGGGNFRVEEYKKPEFEVKIDAPSAPVRLGEKVTATVRAQYYFGAPVTEARVSYKVTRTHYEHSWFPRGEWDWLYGPGYGCFARNYFWYPGWSDWGWKIGRTPWAPWFNAQEPPEVIAQEEVAIGADGTVKIAIDTAPALKDHGDADHRYEISAEVVDASRRTITGTGSVLVARQPFRVFAWLDRGYYRAGQEIEAHFQAHSLDQKPIPGKGKATLLRISYEGDKPVEKAVETWDLDTDDAGKARLKLKAADAGQYRLAYALTDAQGRSAEGGYVFVVTDETFDGKAFRFNDLELVPDKREYAPGERVRLLVNTNHARGTVVLFARGTNGGAVPTQTLRLDGKSGVYDVVVVQKDMPNFFIEGLTVADGKVHDEIAEIIVPPDKKTLNVEVKPSAETYKPGAPAKVQVKLTDQAGEPCAGSTALTMYDKSLEYIAGGSNVPEIRAFFWSWRRTHHARRETNLDLGCGNLVADPKDVMADLGAFGNEAFWGGEHEWRMDPHAPSASPGMAGMGGIGGMGGGMGRMKSQSRVAGTVVSTDKFDSDGVEAEKTSPLQDLDRPPGLAEVQPTIRKAFADAAFWAPTLTTGKDGRAEVTLTMPENLTAWKLRAWAMGDGTQVGQGEAEATTAKELLVRIQAPRFFVQYDEVVLSANIHNYLKTDKDVRAVLELEGAVLETLGDSSQKVRVKAGSEQRVDWRVKVVKEGEAVVRVKALSDEESDAAEMRFPALVHGMLKTESFAGSVRPEAESARLTFRVPEARRPGDSRLEIRVSPTLAGALVDALPYLADYPYGCTEQTLNRFLPTVIAQGVLQRMGLNLKDIRAQRTNLNAQEIGDPARRAAQWKRYPRNPVFDEDEVRRMVREGLKDLTAMQLSEGAWGWFSGFGEHPDAHITALVVHGLQTARKNDVALVPGVYENAVGWLKHYQAGQIQLLKNAATQTKPFKSQADNLDAFVLMVLVDADALDRDMLGFLERDRPRLSVYGLTLFGLALEKLGQKDELARVLKNIEQYLVQDAENQTAYLRLPADCPWWYWYGSETETQAAYLKLLARTDPKGETAPALVKYLLNNRKHATYWNSTRDTALCVEALAEYLQKSGEDRPDMVVSFSLDGKTRKEVKINAGNLFGFDNALVLVGPAVESGAHTVEVSRKGRGPVYFNAYLTYFTLEDPIKSTGLEVKVNRKLYRVHSEERSDPVAGSRGQVVAQKGARDRREELKDLSALKSGDVVEVELEIASKNDYEYLVFEDMKAAGFEPVEVRSGYNGNDLGAYVEFRDQKVCFFTRTLARGTQSVRYRLRAEVPGKFSALPTVGYGMYAPELRANSDEAKVLIED